MREGEELVLEPFERLIETNMLMAYKHEGFWRSMDTLRDRQALEDMVEQGDMPWRISDRAEQARRNRLGRRLMIGLRPRARRASACRSSASAPIPTTSRSAPAAPSSWLIATGVRLDVHWCVLSARSGPRAAEAEASAAAFLPALPSAQVELAEFEDSYFPYQGERHQAMARRPDGAMHARRHLHPSRGRRATRTTGRSAS